MPRISVSPVSGSSAVRNVGSSRVKRCSALATFGWLLVSAGATASDTTGSGTCMLVRLICLPDVKVSPLAQSMPNSATMSPASARSMSSIWSACMRPMRPTLTFLPVRTLTMSAPLCRRPW